MPGRGRPARGRGRKAASNTSRNSQKNRKRKQNRKQQTTSDDISANRKDVPGQNGTAAVGNGQINKGTNFVTVHRTPLNVSRLGLLASSFSARRRKRYLSNKEPSNVRRSLVLGSNGKPESSDKEASTPEPGLESTLGANKLSSIRESGPAATLGANRLDSTREPGPTSILGATEHASTRESGPAASLGAGRLASTREPGPASTPLGATSLPSTPETGPAATPGVTGHASICESGPAASLGANRFASMREPGPTSTLGATRVAWTSETGPPSTLGATRLASTSEPGPAATLGAARLASTPEPSPVATLGVARLASTPEPEPGATLVATTVASTPEPGPAGTFGVTRLASTAGYGLAANLRATGLASTPECRPAVALRASRLASTPDSGPAATRKPRLALTPESGPRVTRRRRLVSTPESRPALTEEPRQALTPEPAASRGLELQPRRNQGCGLPAIQRSGDVVATRVRRVSLGALDSLLTGSDSSSIPALGLLQRNEQQPVATSGSGAPVPLPSALTRSAQKRHVSRLWYQKLTVSAKKRRQKTAVRKSASAILQNARRARERYRSMKSAEKADYKANSKSRIQSETPRYHKLTSSGRKKVIRRVTRRNKQFGYHRTRASYGVLSPEQLENEKQRQLKKKYKLSTEQKDADLERSRERSRRRRRNMTPDGRAAFIKYKKQWRRRRKLNISTNASNNGASAAVEFEEAASDMIAVLDEATKCCVTRRDNRSWQWLLYAIRRRLLTSWCQQIKSGGGRVYDKKLKSSIIAKRVSEVIKFVDIILSQLKRDLKYLHDRFVDADGLLYNSCSMADSVLMEYYGDRRFHSRADESRHRVGEPQYFPMSRVDFTDPMNPFITEDQSHADALNQETGGVNENTQGCDIGTSRGVTSSEQDNLVPQNTEVASGVTMDDMARVRGCDQAQDTPALPPAAQLRGLAASDNDSPDPQNAELASGVTTDGLAPVRRCDPIHDTPARPPAVQLGTAVTVNNCDNDQRCEKNSERHASAVKRSDPLVRLCSSDCSLPSGWITKLHLFLKLIDPNRPLETLKRMIQAESCRACTRGVCDLNRDRCTDVINVLNEAKHHFSGIRTLLRRINSVKQKFGVLLDADQRLMQFNWREFSEFHSTHCKPIIEANNKDFENPGSATTAAELEEKYQMEFHSFRQEMRENLPVHACYCCDRLVRGSDLKKVSKSPSLAKPGAKTIWERLERDIVQEGHGRPFQICKTCFNSVEKGELPRFSRLNGMKVADDSLFKDLNVIERVLIQRIKPFQHIVQLMPYRKKHRVLRLTKGIRGLAIHLPLPDYTVSETLSNYTLPSADHLTILVECPPTKRDMLFRYEVDMNAVIKALEHCKRTNRFYENVSILPSAEIQPVISTIEPATEELLLDDDEFEVTGTDEAATEQRTLLQLSSTSRSLVGFSVQRVDYDEPKESSADLYQLGRVSAPPVFESEPNLDVMSFPHLFPDGKFGMNFGRERKLGDADYIKARMCHKSGRFRRDSAFVFFNAQLRDMKAVSSGIFSTLRVGRASGLTAGNFRKALHVPESEVAKGLLTVLSQVRGTSQYCLQRYSDFAAMDEQIGPATWFCTFSCAEYKWEDLFSFLQQRNPDLAGASQEELCAEDIGSVCIYFFQKFLALLNLVIRSSTGPLGEVTHWAYRVEYQSRGAPHVHCKFWVKGAPVVGESSEFEIIQFVLRYVTCAIPKDALLAELVKTFQVHRCTGSCLRKKSSGLRVFHHCRYGFPRAVCKEAKLNSMDDITRSRAATRKNLKMVEVPRTHEERFINDYCPALLLLWQANMDIQFIGEISMLLNHYVTGYISKAEQNATDDVWASLDPSKSIHSRLYSFARANLKNRELGEYEAFDKLMGTPLFGTSIPIKFVSTAMRDDRKRRLKNSYLMDGLADDSTDIFCNSVTDVYYPNRPECEPFDSMSLMEFVCGYDIVKDGKCSAKTAERQWPLLGGFGFARQREKPCVFKTNYYRCTTDEMLEKYFHSLLMSYVPWRNEDELLAGFPSYQASFLAKQADLERLKTAEATKRSLEKALAWVNDMVKQTEESDLADSSDAGADAWQRQHFDDPVVRPPPLVSEETVQELISGLNERQKACFDKVMRRLDEQDGLVPGTSRDPDSLKLFISGFGGTGKSHVIEALKAAVQRRYSVGGQGEGAFVAVAAPTGVAAKNVLGSTLHRLLKLPIQHGADPKYYKLGAEQVKTLRAAFKDLRLLIVDEISMVSNASLLYMDLRLREIFDAEKPFGGINLVVLGDLLQLRPVFSSFVYEGISKSKVKVIHGGNAKYDMWPEFEYVELTENMRQRDDVRYADLLSRARLGALSIADIEALNDRVLCVGHTGKIDVRGNLGDFAKPCSLEQCAEFFIDELQKKDPKALCLIPKNDGVLRFNHHCMKHLGLKIVVIKAKDFGGRKRKSKKLSERQQHALKASETGGLETELHIAIGGRVMLRRNLSQDLGLVNGSLGTVTAINYRTINRQRSIFSISVKFDDLEEVQEVKTVRTEFNGFGFRGRNREQFPLCPAYSITVHKSQGLSLDTVMLDVGQDCFEAAMGYVGLSRCRQIKNLFLIAFDSKRIICEDKSVKEYNRLRKKFCPDIPVFEHWNTSSGQRKSLTKTFRVTDAANRLPRVEAANRLPRVNPLSAQLQGNANPPPRPSLMIFEQDHEMPNGCFADTTLHVMFSMQQIWTSYDARPDSALDAELLRLWSLWKTPGNEKSSAVRSLSSSEDMQFDDGHQCDFWDFLTHLIDSCSHSVRDAVSCRTEFEFTCDTCGQKSTQTPNPADFILPTTQTHVSELTFTAFLRQRELQELRTCSACNVQRPHWSASSYRNVPSARYILVRIQKFDETRQRIQRRIKNLMTSGQMISGAKYKVVCAVQHLGEDWNSGHYVAWLRNESLRQWYRVDGFSRSIDVRMRFIPNLEDVICLVFEKV